MKTDGKDAAFASDGEYDTYGLTKREHFAAMAMQGVLSSLEAVEKAEKIALAAVLMADALIAELNKEPTK